MQRKQIKCQNEKFNFEISISNLWFQQCTSIENKRERAACLWLGDKNVSQLIKLTDNELVTWLSIKYPSNHAELILMLIYPLDYPDLRFPNSTVLKTDCTDSVVDAAVIFEGVIIVPTLFGNYRCCILQAIEMRDSPSCCQCTF